MGFKVNNAEAVQRIAAQELFANRYETLSGRGGAVHGPGKLPKRFHDEAMSATYVVYSFTTIIAYVTKDGRRVIPDVGYSATTSEHQRMVQEAWGVRQFPARGRDVVPAGGGPRRGGIDDY